MNMQSFFYAGQIPIEDEIYDDVLVGLIQPKRALFYNRGYGAGIADFENAPMNLGTMVMIKYEAARFMALRNGVVTNGNGYPDRRTASSQSIVTVETDGPAINVSVGYIMLSDMVRSKAVSIPIGGLK
jgi:hypothetical protein